MSDDRGTAAAFAFEDEDPETPGVMHSPGARNAESGSDASQTTYPRSEVDPLDDVGAMLAHDDGSNSDAVSPVSPIPTASGECNSTSAKA